VDSGKCHDVPHFVFELPIVADLKLLHPVGLHLIVLPDRVHHAAGDSQLAGQAADTSVRTLYRVFLIRVNHVGGKFIFGRRRGPTSEAR
jgi:hypothetical protein